MRVLILAGGLGTRISEETADKPKPMVKINDKPIIEHLIETFSAQSFKSFVIALGYRGEVIADWAKTFSNRDIDIVTVDTGLNTQTGGRIKRIMSEFPGERIIATYGDGLANVNLRALLAFHEFHGKLATVTAVHPPARFGYLRIENNSVAHFGEKNQADTGWINGGYFVLEPNVNQYIKGDDEPFEVGALPRLVENQQLMAYQHEGFWQPMDTLREKHDLEKLAQLTVPPWLDIATN